MQILLEISSKPCGRNSLVSLSPTQKAEMTEFDIKIVITPTAIPLFLIFPPALGSFYYDLSLCHRNKSNFAAHNRTDTYLHTYYQNYRGCPNRHHRCGCPANLCGCPRTIVVDHLSIVGARAPTKVYKLTPMAAVVTSTAQISI